VATRALRADKPVARLWVFAPPHRLLAGTARLSESTVVGYIARAAGGSVRDAEVIAAADEPDSGIDDRLVAGNVLTMLLAGEDTTANTIAWMVHLLWRNPQALARAVAEVRGICVDGEPPTLDGRATLVVVRDGVGAHPRTTGSTRTRRK
jgi:hypothetical protein